jgi:NADH-quinone oxidoreductase subunit A
MGEYLPLVVLAGLALLFGALSLGASRMLAPRRPSAAKQAPYECGIVPSREPPERFPVSFYIVAMLFIMFDVEIVFLYPYAVSRGTLGALGFWAILEFSVIFFLAFVYAAARGGLEWGPLHRYRSLAADAAMVTPERTLSTTIRRVGMEGRLDARAPVSSDVSFDDDIRALTRAV